VTRVGLHLEPSILPRTETISWAGPNDWNQSGVSLQGIDANVTAMTILPQGFEWDFESGAFDSAWSHSGTSNWAVQSNTRISGTYTAQSGSISHNQVSTMSVTISNMVGTGSFKYRTSTESGWDYLLFCIDSPSCTRYNSFTSKWSGSSSSGTYNFNIASGTHTYYWKYAKDGSVNSYSDTVWVDDIVFTPSGGSGTGEANWTSPKFGTGITGPLGLIDAPYGMMSIDAKLPSGSLITSSIIDATQNSAIPGYEGMTGSFFDLGGIDSTMYPELRVNLRMTTTGGGMPEIYGIHLHGRIASTLEQNPATEGWILNGVTWDGDSISGSGTLTSPLFTSARPIARITNSMSVSGSTDFAVSIDGAAPQTIPTQGSLTLERPGRSVQFFFGANTATAFDLLSFQTDIESGGMAEDASFDIGLDGVDETSLAHPAIGPLGLQDRFGNSERSVQLRWPTPADHSIPVHAPMNGINSFDWLLIPGSVSPENIDWSIKVDGSEVISGSIAIAERAVRVSLNNSEVMTLSYALVNATPSIFDHTSIDLVIGAQQGEATVSGLAIKSAGIIDFDLGPSDALVLAINDNIPTSTLTGLTRLVPLSMRFLEAGALEVTITKLETSSSFTTDSLILNNVSSTLTPSYQWIEVTSTHNVTDGVPARVQVDLAGVVNSATIEVDLTTNTHSLRQTGSNSGDLLLLHSTKPYEHTSIDGFVNSTVRFQINASWDDEELVWLKARIILEDGRRSVPKQQLFGIGTRPGIENDIEVRDWSIRNDLGLKIPSSMSYLKANAEVNISVQLGFEGMDDSVAPRTGDAIIKLYENRTLSEEKLLSSISTFDKGLAHFVFNTPSGTGDVEYRISVASLHGADNSSNLVMNRTFVVDSLAPTLINKNVNDFDHLEPTLNQRLTFEIFDRPVLPTDIQLSLWRDWEDDDDMDGIAATDEYQSYSLNLPTNLSKQQGNYTISIDDSLAPDGGIVHGYLNGGDPAGNLIEGGAFDTPLFVYQLKRDGAPLLSGEGGFIDGTHVYLHPSIHYELTLPIFEPNGVSDIDHILFELASNSAIDRLPIYWNGTSARCETNSLYLIDLDCDVVPEDGDLTAFTSQLNLEIEFELDWGLPLESDLRREPSIEVVDRAGQSAWLTMPSLRWRFSPDLAINSDTLALHPLDGTLSHDGAWIQPSSDIIVNGSVVFPSSGEHPTVSHTVALLFNGIEHHIETDSEGLWEIILTGPASSGSLPMSVFLIELPAQANDLTDSVATRRWITVDGTSPHPESLLAPRLGREIPVASLENLSIEVSIKELEEIKVDSIELHWRLVRRDNSGRPYASGVEAMLLPGGAVAGQALLVRSVVQISEGLPPTIFSEQLKLEVWLTGEDRAGNQITSTTGFNSETNPFGHWDIERQAPLFAIDSDGLSYSRNGPIELGQLVMITIEISNDGEAHGWGNLSLVEQRSDGTTVAITSTPLPFDIQAGGRSTVSIDWEPKGEGHVSVIAIIDGNTLATGDKLEVTTISEEGLDGVLGSTPPVMIAVFAILFLILISVILLAIRTTGEGEEEWDEEMWDDVEQSADVLADNFKQRAAVAPAPAPTTHHQPPDAEEAASYALLNPTVTTPTPTQATTQSQAVGQPAAQASPQTVTPTQHFSSPLAGVDAATYQQWLNMGWSPEQIESWWIAQQQQQQ